MCGLHSYNKQSPNDTMEQTNKQTMRVTKIQIETLKDMQGEEVLYSTPEDSGIVGITYPHIYRNGKKIKLTSTQWLSLYNEYWNSSNNEGYWTKKEAEEEFKI